MDLRRNGALHRPPCEGQEPELSPGRLPEGSRAGSGAAEHQGRAADLRPFFRHVPGFIAGDRIAAVGPVMFFVDNDKPQIGKRREQGGARADHDVGASVRRPAELFKTLSVGETGMQDRHPVAEEAPHPLHRLEGEGDLRDQKDHLPAPGKDFPDHLRVDLGLPAAGDPEKQVFPLFSGRQVRPEDLCRGGLLLREDNTRPCRQRRRLPGPFRHRDHTLLLQRAERGDPHGKPSARLLIRKTASAFRQRLREARHGRPVLPPHFRGKFPELLLRKTAPDQPALPHRHPVPHRHDRPQSLVQHAAVMAVHPDRQFDQSGFRGHGAAGRPQDLLYPGRIQLRLFLQGNDIAGLCPPAVPERHQDRHPRARGIPERFRHRIGKWPVHVFVRNVDNDICVLIILHFHLICLRARKASGCWSS